MTRIFLSLFTIPNSWSFFSTSKWHAHIINITLCKFLKSYTVCDVHRKYSLLTCSLKQTEFPEKMSHQHFSSHMGLNLNPNSLTSLYLENRPNLYSGISTFSEQHKSHTEACDSHNITLTVQCCNVEDVYKNSEGGGLLLHFYWSDLHRPTCRGTAPAETPYETQASKHP